MFTSQQYRAKALEFDDFARIATNANDKREYQKLQQRFAELADNAEWLADHYNQTLHAADTEYSEGLSLAKEEPTLQSGPSDNLRLAQEEERILRLDHAVGDFAPKAATGTLRQCCRDG
jgi:hypothetical protein